MATARFPIGALGLTAMVAIGLAGQARAQQAVIPPAQPWSARVPDASSIAPAAALTRAPTNDCDKHRGPIRAMLHRSHCKRCLEEKIVGFREEFNEWPLGASLYANCGAQVGNADAARMTFYHYDFVDGTDRLNLQGMDKLQEIKAMLPTNFAPVLVERTPARPTLAEARRTMLVAEISRGQFPVPAERVVVGKPVPIGRSGSESAILSLNQISGVLSGSGFKTMGAAGGMGGGGGPSGFDSSGLSGGAIFGGAPGGMGGMMMP